MNTELFLQIALAVISIIGAVITGLLIPYIKVKITAEKMNEIQRWVVVAVKAAEQLFPGVKLGSEKKQTVIDFLANKGVNLSMEELEMLIEAAVKELNLEQSLLS